MTKHTKHETPWGMFSFFVNVLRLILITHCPPWL